MSESFDPQPEPLNPYLRTKVLTANPAELRMLLLDGALRFARRGRTGLAEKNFEEAYNGISQCQSIVMELINALRDDVDPTLCEQLRGLYVFMYSQLVSGLSEKNVEHVDEVIRLLEYERETWSMVMEQFGSGTVASTDAAPGPDELSRIPHPHPNQHAANTPPAEGIIGGRLSVEG